MLLQSHRPQTQNQKIDRLLLLQRPCKVHHVFIIEISVLNRLIIIALINQGCPDFHLRTSSRLCDRSIHLSRSRTATYLSPLISTEIDSVFVTNLTSLLTDGHPIEVDV